METQNRGNSHMSAYDDIQAILRAALEEAKVRHAREVLHKARTAAQLAEAAERYDRFTDHGMIPENFTEKQEI